MFVVVVLGVLRLWLSVCLVLVLVVFLCLGLFIVG